MARTISFVALQVHASRQNAFRADGPLHFQLVFPRRLLDDVGLVDETCVPALCSGRKSGRDFSLCTEELQVE